MVAKKNKKSSKVSGGTNPPRTRHAHYLENVERYKREHPPKPPKNTKEVSTTKPLTTRSQSNAAK